MLQISTVGSEDSRPCMSEEEMYVGWWLGRPTVPDLPELHCASWSSNLKRHPGSLPTLSHDVYPGGAPCITTSSLLSFKTYAYTPF